MLQLRFEVSNARSVEQITPPAFPGFSVISGPAQESGMTAINGAVTQYIALSYILKPKGPGTYTIPAATAKADGNSYKSNPVTVKVTNTISPSAAAPANTNPFPGFNPFEDMPRQEAFNDYILKKGEDASEKISRNMFVKLQTDKTSCYLGEPVIATYKLYTRLKSESNIVKNPSFSGFSVIDLPGADNMSYTRETLNGREYNVYVIRKVQLYPLQAGSLELEAAQVDNNVQFIKEEYASRQHDMANDVFRDFADASIPPEGMETQKVTLQNKPVTINVKPLPAENVPAAFKGAVGSFTIKGALEKNQFSTDDAGKLNVIIKGGGNLPMVTAPDVKWPEGIEGFEPATTEDISKTTVPVSGRKMLSWDFTVTEPGTYVLPPVVFSYFDPVTGRYKTDSTGPIKFTVTKGTGKKAVAVLVKEEQKSWLNKFISNRRWVVSTVVFLIALILLIWLKLDKRKDEKAKQEAAAAAAANPEPAIELPVKEEKNYLEKSFLLLEGESAAFYRELDAALKAYLANRLAIPAAMLNKKIITEQLDKQNVSTGTVIKLQELMNEVELQLYTPFPAQEKKQELYNAAADMIQLLETYKK